MERRLLLTGGALLGLLAVILILGGADTARAGTFNPTIRFCFDDFSTADINPTQPGDPGECDGDNSAGAASTFALGFDVPKGDVNFAGLVTYVPNDWTITPGADFPLGTIVGQLEAIATIGIIGAQCDNILTLVGTAGFTLYNSSLDINDTIEFLPKEKGVLERRDWAEDLDGNGLFDAVDKYPDFINRIIEDEDGNPQQPFRRSAGTIIVAGTDVLLQYLVFEPGTFINKNLPNDPALGYPTVTLLQNLGDPDIIPEPGSITDFCTPLGATATNFGKADPCNSVVNDDEDDDDKVNDGCPALGTSETEAKTEDGSDPCDNNVDDDWSEDLFSSRKETGEDKARVNDGCPKEGDTSEEDVEHVLYRNPPEEGTYTISTTAVGQADADGDGIENSFDTCPFDANEGDPRVGSDGDADTDGLDAACDPVDDPLAGGTNSDQDGDGYLNRGDNCPLMSNGEESPSNQKDSDVDADGDRQADQIGDVCDKNPTSFDGEPLSERIRTLTFDVDIGPPAPGETPSPTTTPSDNGGDDGGGSGTIIIIVAVIAGVVVLGGGAFYFMRRRGGGGATA